MFDDFDGRKRKTFSKREKELIFNSQKGRCMYCGKKSTIHYLEMDHKTPHSKNGSDSLTNIQMLCSPCNKRKGNSKDSEFRKKYKLGASRGAKPPSKVIPQSFFEEKTKKAAVKRANKKRKEDDWFDW